MADTERTRMDAAGQLFDEIGRVHAGMLGIASSSQHPQPMSPHLDREARALYFLTSRETDLVGAVGQGAQAEFTIIGKDHDFFASLQGPIAVSESREKLEQVWNGIAGAWFEGGMDDPRVTLLEMPLAEAAIWSSTGNPVAFAWEIAKSNMASDKTPDLGEHRVIDFRNAA